VGKTNRFVGNILDSADKMGVSSVLSGHVEWQRHVERRHVVADVAGAQRLAVVRERHRVLMLARRVPFRTP
jgi:hypothetical protein